MKMLQIQRTKHQQRIAASDVVRKLLEVKNPFKSSGRGASKMSFITSHELWGKSRTRMVRTGSAPSGLILPVVSIIPNFACSDFGNKTATPSWRRGKEPQTKTGRKRKQENLTQSGESAEAASTKSPGRIGGSHAQIHERRGGRCFRETPTSPSSHPSLPPQPLPLNLQISPFGAARTRRLLKNHLFPAFPQVS